MRNRVFLMNRGNGMEGEYAVAAVFVQLLCRAGVCISTSAGSALRLPVSRHGAPPTVIHVSRLRRFGILCLHDGDMFFEGRDVREMYKFGGREEVPAACS